MTEAAMEDGRPPLAPVGSGRRRPSFAIDNRNPASAIVKHHIIPLEANHKNLTDDAESEDFENRFELMHVKVVIYGLSGILCRKVEKKKRRLHAPTFPANNHNKTSPPVSKKSEGSKVIPPSEAPPTGDEAVVLQVPITAIVAFERKALSSQMSMYSYLPSLPLLLPKNNVLINSRYSASWPADLHSSYLDDECSAMDRSTFTFTRVMKLESFVRGQTCNAMSTYVPETIDLLVHLGRGTEMIPLGTTSLVITGDEEAEVQLNLPVKQLPIKNKRALKTLTACRRKPSFSNDSTSVFILDENARLRIGLQVTPHKTVIAAKARAEREREMMAELEKFVEEITTVPLELSGENDISILGDNEIALFGENERLLFGSPVQSSKSEPSGRFEWDAPVILETDPLSPASGRPQTNFFCGAAICNDRGNFADNQGYIFSDLTMQTRTTLYQRRELSFRESSVMSSISESSDESEFTDVGGLLNRKVVVLKRRPGV